MFIVDSPPDDRWFVASATLESGDVRNMPIFADVEGTDRPPDVSETYPTTLWHRYMTNLRFEEETEKRAFAEYLCRRATGKYDEVDGVTVDYVEQTTRTDGYAEAERVEMLRKNC
jgi:hypothetical protein